VREPERYLHNNATKTTVLIDTALRHAIEAFVFSSTCAVYGLPQTELLSETHDIAPLSPYAESKARVETALDKAATRGLRSASLRYFNAAGADSGGEIGEAHAPETHLLPLAVDAALGVAPPLTCSAPTIRPRTDPASATSSMSATWPMRISGRWIGSSSRTTKACTRPSTSAAGRVTACAR
jgi:thioester reductase-like protein